MTEARTKFIYALRCPVTHEVRYVGASVNPLARYKCHLSEGINLRKRAWMWALKQAGQRPELLILDSCKASEYRRVEDGWTHYYMALGNDMVNAIYSGYNRRALDRQGAYSAKRRQKYLADELARLTI